ncbi:hypothetical protein [Actinomyces weissii]|uniref:Uncharacterized protein n=1 Tax=Actinomyces weissii TaxID=675090 RepID=A0A7T7M9N8_9ACTO|nr:hypothetical protein [Actinomyces weissii]QQM67475.1 hypothetical protein JG540_00775 [Actinomyces weissii]
MAGKSTAARLLRSAVLYLLGFTLVTALASYLVKGPAHLLVSALGLAGIYPFMGYVGRRCGNQDEGDETTKV